MELFVIILVIVLLVGAFLGGRSFGDTIRKGCSFIFIFIIVAIILFFGFYWFFHLR